MADTKPQGASKTYSAVSAPGKVLLAGGYLVLDREYTGLVFGLSARIHVIIKEAVTAEGAEPLTVVKSPQFIDAEWRYSTAILPDGAGVAVKQLERYVMRLYFYLHFFKPYFIIFPVPLQSWTPFPFQLSPNTNWRSNNISRVTPSPTTPP